MPTMDKGGYRPSQAPVYLVPPSKRFVPDRHIERRLKKYPLEDEYVDIWSEVNRTGTLTGGLIGFLVGVLLTGGLIYLMVVMG